MKNHLYFFLLLLIFTGCCEIPVKPNDTSGLRPVYVQLGDNIAQEPMLFDDLTNIVVYQELILAIEENTGIHIIDNTDPINPTNILFIPIYGLSNIAIKEDIIIANVGDRLLSIDLSDRSKAIIKNIKRFEIEDVSGQEFYPEGYNGLFECVDPDKGIVLVWELVDMDDSDCWR